MYSGVVIHVPIRQTPRRGDRLLDPATAAKKQTAQHASRVTRKPFIEQTCALNLRYEQLRIPTQCPD